MIITFGSINLDLAFPLETLPRPGETVLGKTFIQSPGGKGANQALAAARAGSETKMIGKVGADSLADSALELLRAGDVDLSKVGQSTLPTGCATIWIDKQGENSIAVASGANLEVMADQVDDDLLTQNTWLLLQMEINSEENWKLIRRAKVKGCSILLNNAPAAPIPEEILSLIDILVVNEIEAQMIAEVTKTPYEKVTDIPALLAEKYGTTCVLTLGGDGSLCSTENGGIVKTPALSITPVNTTAAGDTFSGYLAAALEQGQDLETALKWASVAGGLCCEKDGAQTAIPMQNEMLKALTNLI